nr:hypothetical protein [Arthrospira sp. PLM2.Bin9]
MTYQLVLAKADVVDAPAEARIKDVPNYSRKSVEKISNGGDRT